MRLQISPRLPLFDKREFFRVVRIGTKVVLNTAFLVPCGGNKSRDNGTQLGRAARLGREMGHNKHMIGHTVSSVSRRASSTFVLDT